MPKIAYLLNFGLAIFLAAFLMFLLEPMVAKMLIPSFGGSPSVWNSCVVFFQSVLLAGYLYAHLVSSRLAIPVQILLHLIVLWLPLIFLPVNPPVVSRVTEHPFLAIFAILTTMIAAVFFAISTTAPLLQRWYAGLGVRGSSDPYFLYSASNIGALTGLVAYPFWLEPNVPLKDQAQLILIIYVVYAVLVTLALAGVFIANRSAPAAVSSVEAVPKQSGILPQSIQTWCRWALLAVVPSSLVLGLTGYVTSELSSVPFFWVVPLFLYLLSFVLAFARLPAIVERITQRLALAAAAIVTILTLYGNSMEALFGDQQITTGLSIHVVSLFLICCAFHFRLAKERPDSRHLTEYYFLISLGGVLGSSFNTFIAPTLFKEWIEYPLALFLALVVLSNDIKFPNFRLKVPGANNLALPVLMALIICLSWSLSNILYPPFWAMAIEGRAPNMVPAMIELVLQFLVPLASCWLLSSSIRQFRLGVGVLALCIFSNTSELGREVVHQTRNFFGTLSVTYVSEEQLCAFWHGYTLHGTESVDPDKRGMPVSYYYPSGPIGTMMRRLFGEPKTLIDRETARVAPGRSQIPRQLTIPKVQSSPETAGLDQDRLGPIAVLGLGCGTTAAYANPGQKLVYYEINPKVIEIASDPFYFTYLFQAVQRKVDLRIVEGDGRLEIQKEPYRTFKLILVDAFNSDSIPTHLLTKEAVEVYLAKLRPDGIVAFNISNQYYNLQPVLASLAQALDIPAMTILDSDPAEKDRTSTSWVAFSRDKSMLELLKSSGWKPLYAKKKMRVWTDDYCSPLSVLMSPFS